MLDFIVQFVSLKFISLHAVC